MENEFICNLYFDKDKIQENKQEKNHIVYQEMLARDYLLPTFNNSLFNEQFKIWFQTNNYYLPSKSQLIEKNICLVHIKDHTYNIIQTHLYNETKKILPFDKTPDVEYIKKIVLILDYENKLQLWRESQGAQKNEQVAIYKLTTKLVSYQNTVRRSLELQKEKQDIVQKIQGRIQWIDQIKKAMSQESQLVFGNKHIGLMYDKVKKTINENINDIKRNFLSQFYSQYGVDAYIKYRQHTEHVSVLRSVLVFDKELVFETIDLTNFNLEQDYADIKSLSLFLGSFKQVKLTDTQINFIKLKIQQQDDIVLEESNNLLEKTKQLQEKQAVRQDIDRIALNEISQTICQFLYQNTNYSNLVTGTLHYLKLEALCIVSHTDNKSIAIQNSLKDVFKTKPIDTLQNNTIKVEQNISISKQSIWKKKQNIADILPLFDNIDDSIKNEQQKLSLSSMSSDSEYSDDNDSGKVRRLQDRIQQQNTNMSFEEEPDDSQPHNQEQQIDEWWSFDEQNQQQLRSGQGQSNKPTGQ